MTTCRLILCSCLVLAAGCQSREVAPANQPAAQKQPALTAQASPQPEADPAQAAAILTGEAGKNGRLGYPRFPDIHGQQVVFSAENDLWLTTVAGGLARRLTVHEGNEFFAKFSPDGKWLAFSGDYDGNQDIFVMPAVGGVPQRLTFHPARDQAIGWTPDGASILFRSQRHHPHGNWTLHTIPRLGGDPVRLPLSRAARLSWEPKGKRVAINRLSRDFRRWKRYAGGMAVQIFIGDLEGGPFHKVTTFKGTNAYPMWHGERIYFLSDRTGTQNIWSMTADAKDLRQHTQSTNFDVRFPSIGQDRIVYQAGASLRLLDVRSGQDREIPVRIVSDALRTRTRFTDPKKHLRSFALSPDGAFLALQIRGNLHLVPAQKEGRRIQVSRSSDSHERGISFSPDGSQIATVSSQAGEDEIFLYDTLGAKKPQRVTTDGKRFKHPPLWSPTKERIAFADSDNRLYLVSAGGGKTREVDHSPFGPIEQIAWSPDGKWLAYVKAETNYLGSIFLFQVETGAKARVTNEFFHDSNPTWSPDGKYLYFLSRRSLNPYLDELDFETIVDKTTKPYLVLLSAKTPSPFLPTKAGQDDERMMKVLKRIREEEKRKREFRQPPQVEIDLSGMGDRIVEVPVDAGNYHNLWAGREFILFLKSPMIGMADWGELFSENTKLTSSLMRFEMGEKEKGAKTYLADVRSFCVSRNGKRIATMNRKKEFFVFQLGDQPPAQEKLAKKKIPIAAIREQVEPLAEWRQIFFEVWRMMRDFYWEPHMANVDWLAMQEKYLPLLSRVATRAELEDLLGEMVAELSLGHTYIWGGDQKRARPISVGLLGADLAPDASGLYRFTRVYQGANWDKKRVSPLTLPHVGVVAGDFLLKIDGRPIKAGDNVYSRLQKAAGEFVLLTVHSRPSLNGARDVEIKTLANEKAVRYFSWVAKNRVYVSEKTGDQVGYLHLPDMMTRGMVEFDRWYYPQIRKQGLIIDARWNGGGFVSGILIKKIMRDVLFWVRSREGFVGTYPSNSLRGRVVVLTNESAGSDGDIFPRAIQIAKIGPVIGTRTWGGVVGIDGSNPLVDGGTSTRPHYFALYERERKWGVEGEGVVPDIIVDNDTGAVDRGQDAQLDRGIAEVLERLRQAPAQRPDFVAPPDKSKEAWVKKYGQTDKP